MVEKNLSKIDDMSRSIDRIIHDVENLKIKKISPKIDVNKSIKALYVSVDESKKRTLCLELKENF